MNLSPNTESLYSISGNARQNAAGNREAELVYHGKHSGRSRRIERKTGQNRRACAAARAWNVVSGTPA
jgi:hypothetical protein